ncbi:IS66 family transposase [Desulfococcus multivorans]|uniref:Transposase IS66 n=1 Tax=Desulfococcus multivorans DSM 2059 TaxID=1121405 RepID=S7U660_DESML|nr:IS66 family transposase [Desulfococcus multivorans]AQV02591.1 IS66 family transposase [Desulfococcus multivorans]EPR44807.1 transposase IS66 [Desulfococcus multivorans DSM 2059]SKA29572.1 zinc-finger binding domain of transposase IS66 [Desulfococcus multivorans DSM 2059]
MTRDEAAAILDLPREQAIDAILTLADKAEKFDRLCGTVSPTCPSGMTPPYLKEPGKKRRKKPGRKKGHSGVARKRPEKIDHYREHTLESCPECRLPLGKPIKNHKRYIMDIPPVAVEVTEHTVHGYWCSNCKKAVYPRVTDALPNAVLGINLLVMTAWLHYWVGMSVRNVARLLAVFCAFDVSPGGLTQAWKNLSVILKPLYDDIGKKIQKSAVLHADETGWRISGLTHWLWCFATDRFCYFIIDKSRGSPVIKKVIGKLFEGILICDFWGAYNKIATLATQRCFYHLFTELAKVDKCNKSADWKLFRKKLGRLLMDAVRLSVMKAELASPVFDRRKMRLYLRLDQLIASSREDKDVNRLIKRLIRHRNEFFTFLEYNGVSPYNNHAEQQIRKPVLTRKISQQNRSNQGAEAHAIFMTLFRSAELQGLNPFDTVLHDAKKMLGAVREEDIALKLAA